MTEDKFNPEIESIDESVRKEAQITYDIASLMVEHAALRGLNIERQGDYQLFCSNMRNPNINCIIFIDDGKITIETRYGLRKIDLPFLKQITKFGLADPECFNKITDFLEEKMKGLL